MISIIVINRNNVELLKKCIESIKSHITMPYEIIVVDNGSVDSSVQIAKDLGCRVIENRINYGAVIATNQGIKAAKYDNIIRMDNDVEIIKGSLDDLFNVNGDIVGCKLLNSDGTIHHAGGFFTATKHGHIGMGEIDGGQYEAEGEVYYVCSALVAIKRKVIDKIGLFDEGFKLMYFEDTDYCQRAIKAGFKVLYSPLVRAIHYGSGRKGKDWGRGMTSKGLSDKNYIWEYNRLRFIRKHYPLTWFIQYLIREIPRVILMTVRNKDLSIFRAYRDIIVDR